MRHVTVLLGLCVLFQCCSPIPKMENRNMRIYTEEDTVVEFHLLERGKEVKVDFNRVYYWYSGQQISRSQGAYTGHLLDGEYLVKLRSQQLLEKGVFEKGQKEGTWLLWHANGRVKQKQEWMHGLLEGTLEEYDTSGILIRTSEYKKGLLDGMQTTYLEGGRKHVQEFDKGELQENEKNAPGLLGRMFKKKENISVKADSLVQNGGETSTSIKTKSKPGNQQEENKGMRSGQLQTGGKNTEKKAGFFKRLFGESKKESKEKK